ncbi:MAG TPA: copper chaperone PCu(A)C [Burkholderiales bacterium]|nr:copper chaperone PCu(A)C [Burkholderiales bacterium]
MKLCNAAALAIGIIVAMPVYAGVTVSDAWIRATAPGQTSAAVYLQIKSDAAAKLVGASSPAAKTAQIHEMSMQGNVMKMRPIDALDLPAGKTVELKPGGYHVMLENIAKPLKKGATVPVTLTIEGADKQRQSLEVKAEVREAQPEKHDDMKGMGDMKDMGNMKGM